jgi:hypothetical protein
MEFTGGGSKNGFLPEPDDETGGSSKGEWGGGGREGEKLLGEAARLRKGLLDDKVSDKAGLAEPGRPMTDSKREC